MNAESELSLAIDCRMSGKSGIGTFLDGLLPHLCNTSYKILLIGSNEIQKHYEINENVTVEICNIKPFSIKELFLFPKNIRNKINECNAYFSPYCNIPSGIKIPIFTTIHDIIFLDVKGITGFFGTFIRKCFYQYAIKKSNCIFTVSEFSKQRIQARLHCKKDIFITYNGLPSYLENKNPDDYTIEKESLILFVGNIKKHKGLSVLIEAFSEFSKVKSAKLVIVGDKDNFRTKDTKTEYLMQQASNNIVFTGRISNESLFTLLKKANVLVQPSFYEGFGIPPLEALYCGTKVIVSDIPVFKEIYGSLPVFFFKTGDSKNLKEKLLEVWNTKQKNVIIPKKYSYKVSAQEILSDIVTFTSKE
ncbi:MAG: glycosyltransferase family 4 protein [Treponema sp.]|nr:glycosyltransferase family 4 protein [Treponema sp.]